jgi:hypothetical protein
MDDGVELAELIQQLRRELTAAMAAGDGEQLRFEAGPVQLELTVAIQKSVDPSARVRFYVLDAGASARRGSTVTQRIMLTLDPRRVDSPDRPPLISGEQLTGER